MSTVDTITACSLQYYMKIFGGWRDFESDDLKKLTRVYWIIKNNETPNDFDKEIIAYLCELGYDAFIYFLLYFLLSVYIRHFNFPAVDW